MATAWKSAGKYTDILYHKAGGIARITINRPDKRNAFRPQTVSEMHAALLDAREDQKIGVVLLTGAGPAKDGKYAFCAGADQSGRGHGGSMAGAGAPRLNTPTLPNVLRTMP